MCSVRKSVNKKTSVNCSSHMNYINCKFKSCSQFLNEGRSHLASFGIRLNALWKNDFIRFWSVIVLLLVIICSCFSTAFGSLDSTSSSAINNEFSSREELVKNLWNELTEHELHHIFGKPQKDQENVPNNLDIISPLVISHRKIKRRKSKSSSINYNNQLNHHQQHPAVVRLHGLGRDFSLTLTPNPHLIHPGEFVHLLRHENYTDILPDELVWNRLDCFYHGHVQHVKKRKFHGSTQEENRDFMENSQPNADEKHDPDDVRTGRLAMDICNGLSGFIVPSDNDPEHHYVIHPVPKRLHSKSAGTENPHFLWQKSNDENSISSRMLMMTTMMSPLENIKEKMNIDKHSHNNNNNNGQKDKVTSGRKSSYLASLSPASCGHQHDEFHLYEQPLDDVDTSPVAISTDANDIKNMKLKQTMNNNKMKFDDDELLHTKDMHMQKTRTRNLKKNNHGDIAFKKRNRLKRSPLPQPTSYIDDGQFQYKPLSIASDSYWLRFRTTDSPTVNQKKNTNNRKLTSSSSLSYVTASSSSSSQADPWARGQHLQFRNNDELNWSALPQGDSSKSKRLIDSDGSPSSSSPYNQNQNDHDWAKGILVYEASRPVPSVAEPLPYASSKYSSKLPFFTSQKSDDHAEYDENNDEILNRAKWLPNYGNNNRRSTNVEDLKYRYHNNETNFNSRWTSFPSSSSPVAASNFEVVRKGRRDDSIFGDKWYTSLDYTSPDSNDPMISSPSILSTINERQSSLNSQNHNKELSHLTIETAVFIDKDLFKHMQTNFPDDTHGEVARIVLAMINAVQLLYQDPSLGHRVDFVLKRLEILETDPVGLLRPLDIDRFLTNFCKWQKLENPPNDAHFLHWDHALILTGLDLYVVHQSGKISNQVVGLAPVAGMCTRSSSCTVNEGRHFESVYVVAHEIGHNLGMRHDGILADNDCDPTSHIMSPTLGSGKISWSPCSKRYLDMFLETAQSKCLLDKAKSESRLDHESDGRLPGERFDSDKQCVLKYGRGSFHAEQQPIEDVCRDLHCRKEHYTWTSHPALEGTFCGKEMWCRSGKCIPKLANLLSSGEKNSNGNSDSFFGHSQHSHHHNHLDKSETAAYSASRPIEGGWGKWSPYTDCSSACLYTDDGSPVGSTGIRLAARRCDSPRPENGGLQCFGLDRRYKTCSTEAICPFETSKSTITQYANEVCTRAATVDTELSGRGFMTKTNDPDRACSVWCETLQRSGSRSRGWSFPDGTSCELTSRQNSQSYCIAGKCQEFTCDSSSHFVQSDELCNSKISSSFNNGRKASIVSSDFENPDHGIPKTWFHTSVSSSSVSSSISSAKNRFHVNITGNNFNNYNNNHENEVFGWTSWESHSECKLSCLEPAKGLELVQRRCNIGDKCNGVALSVRLCKPSKSTILSKACARIQTPFEYATKVCNKYSRKINGLSGIGMQLSSTNDDVDRPCHIGCQDSSLPYRFYMVNGEEGWFPSGTDCSRGEPMKKAFCLSGKCIEFGEDDTPNYRLNVKSFDRLQPAFREKRDATNNLFTNRNEGKLSQNTPKYLLDQTSLHNLIQKYVQLTNTSESKYSASSTNSKFDFSNPILLERDFKYKPKLEEHEEATYFDEDDDLDSSSSSTHWSTDNQLQPLEGSFYEWRKIMSDCSVTCGSGIREVIVQCISGDTVVNDSFCPKETRPGISTYISCTAQKNPSCETTDSSIISNHSYLNSTFLWNWLELIRLSASSAMSSGNNNSTS